MSFILSLFKSKKQEVVKEQHFTPAKPKPELPEVPKVFKKVSESPPPKRKRNHTGKKKQRSEVRSSQNQYIHTPCSFSTTYLSSSSSSYDSDSSSSSSSSSSSDY